ncbi:phosphatase PAP2 family protein [Fulvivirgaceae bacterium PWU4]|uniref:Phosphatase PAP2 family protein n=1 Tax=Chryseosolibacter histidini TaxID=2782349 RepID=A0AAP2DST9_9BACT|nr:phosphatase PAP2 family protein [Chryseosolibacter histidini]MBT1700678.1 phosphatase PAP2 family protein [Chryseosolibacter histidini]
MIDQLLELDREIFLYLNGFHTPWLDPIMLFITETLSWLPLHLFLLYLIFKDHQKKGWLVLIGLVLTIVLADQVTSTLMKPYFARFRPSHEPALQSLVHIVNGYKGGKFGFASSHAANTFGVANFLFLLFGKTRKWIVMLFLWAALVTYSRIYLGVHYPGDILVGALVGMLSAMASFWFYRWLKKIYDNRKKQASPSGSPQ